jgi:hypothetical protein
MQTVNLTPAGPVPTCVDMLPPNPPPTGGNLRLVPALTLLLEDVVARLATDGDSVPPPQPAASNANPVTSKSTARGDPRPFIP